jgi:spermidine/putrescine transport system substrate-binding protein
MIKKVLLFFVSAALVVSCTKKVPSVNNIDNSQETKYQQVNLFIWSNYISNDLIKEFEEKTHIKVVISNYASNEELLAKLQAGATGYDIIVPSDYMINIMIKLNLLKTLDKNKIPNAANLDANFLTQEFDPKNEFSLPYGWTTTGIAINRKYFKDPIKSWKDLFENPKLKGKISVLDDNREVFAAALKQLGFSVNTQNVDEIKKAKDYLVAHKAQTKSYLADPMESISMGEVWAAQMYSSDALQAQEKNKDIEYVLPSEGCTLAIDNLAIPQTAKNTEAAYQLINFMLSQKTSLNFVKVVKGSPVVKGVKEELPEALQKNENLFPPLAQIKKMEMMKDLGKLTLEYDKLWTELKSR